MSSPAPLPAGRLARVRTVIGRTAAAPALLRIAWLALPLLAGPALADALDVRSADVRTTASSLAWLGWAAGLLAVLVPRTVTLTVARMLLPGGLAVAAWATANGADGTDAVLALTGALVVLGALWHPATVDAFVDGSSYGTERRLALRTPVAVAAGPVPVVWALAAAGTVSGPLLVAAGRPAAGVAAGIVGVAVAVAAARLVHTLSRRWLVFVPAGIVVHDPLVLVEPVLLPRHLLVAVGPAPADSGAVDLTGGALGLAFELRARTPFSLGRRRGRGSTEIDHVDAVLVVPARPAATLDTAHAHRLPVA